MCMSSIFLPSKHYFTIFCECINTTFTSARFYFQGAFLIATDCEPGQATTEIDQETNPSTPVETSKPSESELKWTKDFVPPWTDCDLNHALELDTLEREQYLIDRKIFPGCIPPDRCTWWSVEEKQWVQGDIDESDFEKCRRDFGEDSCSDDEVETIACEYSPIVGNDESSCPFAEGPQDNWTAGEVQHMTCDKCLGDLNEYKDIYSPEQESTAAPRSDEDTTDSSGWASNLVVSNWPEDPITHPWDQAPFPPLLPPRSPFRFEPRTIVRIEEAATSTFEYMEFSDLKPARWYSLHPALVLRSARSPESSHNWCEILPMTSFGNGWGFHGLKRETHIRCHHSQEAWQEELHNEVRLGAPIGVTKAESFYFMSKVSWIEISRSYWVPEEWLSASWFGELRMSRKSFRKINTQARRERTLNAIRLPSEERDQYIRAQEEAALMSAEFQESIRQSQAEDQIVYLFDKLPMDGEFRLQELDLDPSEDEDADTVLHDGGVGMHNADAERPCQESSPRPPPVHQDDTVSGAIQRYCQMLSVWLNGTDVEIKHRELAKSLTYYLPNNLE